MLASVRVMKPITRRDALAGVAVLALPGRPAEAGALEENPRPVWVPVTTSSPFLGDLSTLNAKLYELHEGRVWAYDHRDALPTDYDELDRMPLNIRQAVIEALPIATAVGLVLERIERSADADALMTDEQRAVLASAPVFVTPEWAEATNEEREAMYPDGGFWQRAKGAFSMDDWRRIFGRSDAIDGWCLARFATFGDCARAVGW